MPDVSLSAGVDTSQVATGMASIQNEVARAGRSIESIFSSLLSPAALISTALTAGLRGLINYGSRIQDLADRFKVSTTALQQFGAIAEENGSSLEGLAKGFNRLALALSQARSGNEEMQHALERLGVDNWADRSLKLSDAVLQVGTSSMDAADMVKVFGREGTALAETFRFAAENAGKLGKAISPEMIKKLDELDDRWKRMWVNVRVGAADAIESLEKLDNWLGKLSGRRIDFSQGFPRGVNDQFAPGGGGFGGRGAGSDFAQPTGQQIPPDEDAVARMDQYLEANQLVEQTLAKEYDIWFATLSTQDQLIEVQNQRVALEKELYQAVNDEGEGSDRVWEIRGEIADIVRETIPLQTQLADEQARAADETARQADEEARVANEAQRAADEATKRNQEAEQGRIRASYGPNPLTVNALAENNLRLGATSDVYAAALAASRGIKPGSPEYDRLVMQIQAQDRLTTLQGRNPGFYEQLNRDKLVQWYADQQQREATTRAGISHQQEIDYWQAIATRRSPGNNPYTNIYGTAPFRSVNMIPGQDNTAQIAQLSAQINIQKQQLDALQQLVRNTEPVNLL